MKGKNTWAKGKKHTEESKRKISEKLKGRISPMKGRKHKPKPIIKMKESHSKAKI